METQNQVKGNGNNFSDNVWLSAKPKIVNKLTGKPHIDDKKQSVNVIVNSVPKVVDNISAIPSQIDEKQTSLKTLQKFITYLKASDKKKTANLPTEISTENINKNVYSKPVVNVQKSTNVRLTAKPKIAQTLTDKPPPIGDKKQPVKVIVNSEPKVVDNKTAIPSQIGENESSLKTLEKLILYFKATDKKKNANIPIVISPDIDDNKELNRRKRSFGRNPISTTKNGSSAKIHDINFDHCYCKEKEEQRDRNLEAQPIENSTPVAETSNSELNSQSSNLDDRGLSLTRVTNRETLDLLKKIEKNNSGTPKPTNIEYIKINQSDTELDDDLFCLYGPSELEIIESPWRRIQYQFSKRYKQAIESASYNIDHLLIKLAEPVIKTENLK